MTKDRNRDVVVVIATERRAVQSRVRGSISVRGTRLCPPEHTARLCGSPTRFSMPVVVA
jgi:hypothetical protein